MGKINILHIYQNSKIGGVQRQMLSLVREYNRKLFNPIVCCFGPRQELGKELEKLNLDFIALNVNRYHRFSPTIIIKLYQLMRKRNIHIVRTHKYRASLYGRIAASIACIPVVITSVHGNYRKDLRLERKIANRVLARITDRIVAVSESIKQDILKYDNVEPSRVLVIQNGVDISKFDPEGKFHDIRREFAISENDIIIGFIGRLVPAKGLEYLIDAFLILEKEQKNIKLFITGEGSLLDCLKERLRKHSINERVIFTGKRLDIPDILSAIDIFVIPSLAEGLPNSLLEAMSMGKPIIATSIGGIPEVIKNEINGLLVPPRNIESLVEAIKKLIADKHLASEIGKNARNYVIENLSIQATTRKWESLYISLLKEKGITIAKETEKVNAK